MTYHIQKYQTRTRALATPAHSNAGQGNVQVVEDKFDKGYEVVEDWKATCLVRLERLMTQQRRNMKLRSLK